MVGATAERLSAPLYDCVAINGRTSTVFPSGYSSGSRSRSTTMLLTTFEKCFCGSLSLLRVAGSNTLPSILRAHDAIPCPVSKFGGSADGFPAFCQAWSETVWLRNTRSVLVVCYGFSRLSVELVGARTYRRRFSKSVLYLCAFPRHRLVELLLSI